MNLSHTSDDAFTHRRESGGMGDQTGNQLAQIKPVVEPIAESAELLAGVLAGLEGFVCSADHEPPRNLRRLRRLRMEPP